MDYSLKNLPVRERIRLVEDPWDSIASNQNSIYLSSARKAGLDKRLEEYEVQISKVPHDLTSFRIASTSRSRTGRLVLITSHTRRSSTSAYL